MPQCHKPECTMFHMSYVIFLANHSVQKVETNKTSSAPPNPSCLSQSHPIPPAQAAHKSFFSFFASHFLTFHFWPRLVPVLHVVSFVSPSLFSLSLLHTFPSNPVSCVSDILTCNENILFLFPFVEESQTQILNSSEIRLGFCLGNCINVYSLL